MRSAYFDLARKIGIIKVVRELTGVGLAEAKALVESCPIALRTGVPATEAEALQAKLEAVGAEVSLR